MVTRRDFHWPPVGRTHGHQRGRSTAIDGENPTAIGTTSPWAPTGTASIVLHACPLRGVSGRGIPVLIHKRVAICKYDTHRFELHSSEVQLSNYFAATRWYERREARVEGPGCAVWNRFREQSRTARHVELRLLNDAESDGAATSQRSRPAHEKVTCPIDSTPAPRVRPGSVCRPGPAPCSPTCWRCVPSGGRSPA